MTGHPLRLDAIELQSRRHVAMIRWYQIVLEAEVIHRDAMQCWLRTGAGTTLILVASAQAPRPREVAGIAGPAFAVADEGALGSLVRRLERLDVYPERALRNILATSVIYRDPDGNPVAVKALAATVPAGAVVDPLGEEIDPRNLGRAPQAQAS
jgi:catechol-2,3-dioxygenase